jgi:hypothetical protein
MRRRNEPATAGVRCAQVVPWFKAAALSDKGAPVTRPASGLRIEGFATSSQEPSMPDKPISDLHRRMLAAMSIRSFSDKTRQNYIHHVETLTAFLGHSPAHRCRPSSGLGGAWSGTAKTIRSALQIAFLSDARRPFESLGARSVPQAEPLPTARRCLQHLHSNVEISIALAALPGQPRGFLQTLSRRARRDALKTVSGKRTLKSSTKRRLNVSKFASGSAVSTAISSKNVRSPSESVALGGAVLPTHPTVRFRSR